MQKKLVRIFTLLDIKGLLMMVSPGIQPGHGSIHLISLSFRGKFMH